MADMSIAQIAATFGLTLRTLRFWEQKGLIKPRRVGTRRIYNLEQYRRVEQVKLLADAGIPLADIHGFDAASDRMAFLAERLDAVEAEIQKRVAGIARLRRTMRSASNG